LCSSFCVTCFPHFLFMYYIFANLNFLSILV
jgi:hypothetical protein